MAKTAARSKTIWPHPRSDRTQEEGEGNRAHTTRQGETKTPQQKVREQERPNPHHKTERYTQNTTTARQGNKRDPPPPKDREKHKHHNRKTEKQEGPTTNTRPNDKKNTTTAKERNKRGDRKAKRTSQPQDWEPREAHLHHKTDRNTNITTARQTNSKVPQHKTERNTQNTTIARQRNKRDPSTPLGRKTKRNRDRERNRDRCKET